MPASSKKRASALVLLILVLSVLSILTTTGFHRVAKVQESALRQDLPVEQHTTKASKIITAVLKQQFSNNGTAPTQGRFANSLLAMKAARGGLVFALIHVGKCGGSTLDTKLLHVGCVAKRNPEHKRECRKFHADTGHPQSALSKYTKVIAHYDRFVTPQKTLYNGLIFSIREPLSRLESAYYFDSPFHCVFASGVKCQKNKKRTREKDPQLFGFYEAFPTLDALANGLHPEFGNQEKNKNALQLLKEYFHTSGVTSFGHVTAGYRHHAKLANFHPHIARSAKLVFATRTEHLWQDAEHIDELLGGSGNFSYLHSENVNHIPDKGRVNQVKLANGANETKYICCALLPEIQMYRQIVEHAVNLEQQDKIRTYQMTWDRCGVTSWEMLEKDCAATTLSIDDDDEERKGKELLRFRVPTQSVKESVRERLSAFRPSKSTKEMDHELMVQKLQFDS